MGNLLFTTLREKALYRVECTAEFDETITKTMNLDLFIFCEGGTLGPLHLYGLRPGMTYVQEHFVTEMGSVQHVEVSLRQHHAAHVASKFTLPSINVHELRDKSARSSHFSVDGEVHLNDACGLSILLQPKQHVVDDERYTYNGKGEENGMPLDDIDVV
jgi:hypothetical protein